MQGAVSEVREFRVLEERLVDQEAMARRNNLLFFGVEEKEGENCVKIVSEIVQDLGISDREFPMQIAYRLRPPSRNNEISQRVSCPRPIIVKFVDFRDKEAVRYARHKLRKPISVLEDFPIEIREARKSLEPELREMIQTTGKPP